MYALTRASICTFGRSNWLHLTATQMINYNFFLYFSTSSYFLKLYIRMVCTEALVFILLQKSATPTNIVNENALASIKIEWENECNDIHIADLVFHTCNFSSVWFTHIGMVSHCGTALQMWRNWQLALLNIGNMPMHACDMGRGVCAAKSPPRRNFASYRTEMCLEQIRAILCSREIH